MEQKAVVDFLVDAVDSTFEGMVSWKLMDFYNQLEDNLESDLREFKEFKEKKLFIKENKEKIMEAVEAIILKKFRKRIMAGIERELNYFIDITHD